MLELDYITVRGFKSIASIEKLGLGPLNVLIGPNGSGKSNFIGAFSFLNAIRSGGLQGYVARSGGADKILHFGSKETDEIRIEVSFQQGKSRYSISLLPGSRDDLVPGAETAFSSNGEKMTLVRSAREAGMSEIPADGPDALQDVKGQLDRWRLYHFHDTGPSSPMKKTADLNDNRHLRPGGSNLSAFLYLLRRKHPDAYGLITRTVRQVAPFFDRFQLEPQLLNPNKIQLEWRHAGSDAYFDAASLSDGTLRFMALATLFLQPEGFRPSVILVDEPELGMHPYAITLLASLMKQAAAETQVIVSTQSSLLLDHFEPEEVLVADRIDRGTQLTRLDSAELEPWLEEYSLGQLWEKNELGGRPRAE